jgi:hypothetical protein
MTLLESAIILFDFQQATSFSTNSSGWFFIYFSNLASLVLSALLFPAFDANDNKKGSKN